VSNGNPCGDHCAGQMTDNCGIVYTCHQDCSMEGECPCRGGMCSAAAGNFCVCTKGECN
jgi:hypothetical protein